MITVRLATLADTRRLTDIHCSLVERWERADPGGPLVETPYDKLSLYERWEHGGPWMSVETCAVHLNRLLAGSGTPLVAELNGDVRAMAEVYESHEPPPLGHNLEISVIATHRDFQGRGLGTALLDYIAQMGRLTKCERLTVSDADTPEFYIRRGFRHTHSGRGVRITPQLGRVFYQATELTSRDAAQITGWGMPLGRYRSSRQEWDRLFPQDWAAGIPELLDVATAHVKMTVTGGQHMILFARDAFQPDAGPGDVSLACWAPRSLTPQMLAAIRDWAHRSGYPRLISFMLDADLPLLGADGEITDYRQDVYERALE
ncbi:MAG: GNAT family N-acetyltransferase [Anaerolineae bacterium]|nr:GNAT family N-acetyltransferase [Anaerolineae bacterium]